MGKKKIEVIEATTKSSVLINRIEGFSSRFNIHMMQNGKNHFKNRCISAIGEFMGTSIRDVNSVSSEVFYLLGLPYTHTSVHTDYCHTDLYRVLTNDALKIEGDASLFRWLMILECVLNIDINDILRNIVLAHKVAESLKVSGINAVLCDTANGYVFYPANAELLDQKLIVDTLNWLDNYSDAKEQYNTALRTFLKGDHSRNVIDCLRLSVELFFKKLFNNGASLENQLKRIGEYLKSKGVSGEIRNMYVKLLDCFATYNNQHIKHNDHSNLIGQSEIEYMIYTTGAFLRLIVQLEKEKAIVK